MCYCGAVVMEFLARADKPGSTPGDAAFCFFVPFFPPVWSIFFDTIFPFGLFFFILTADHIRAIRAMVTAYPRDGYRLCGLIK